MAPRCRQLVMRIERAVLGCAVMDHINHMHQTPSSHILAFYAEYEPFVCNGNVVDVEVRSACTVAEINTPIVQSCS